MIKKSTSRQINDFRGAIHDVYGFENLGDFYKDEMEAVCLLIEELKTYKREILNKEKIKAINVEYLINDLEDILERLS
jgi:hypothetical protein